MSMLYRTASDSSDSDEESEPEEEETKNKFNSKQPERQQLQQRKGEEQSESDSDTDSDSEPESRYNIVKRDDNSKVATKAPVAGNIPGKRGRDANGVKVAPTEEPLSKKRKEAANDGKARSQAEKLSSPAKSPAKKGEKTEPAMRGTKAIAAGKAEKAKALSSVKVENVKPHAAGRKRKASTPPPGRQQVQKVEVDKSSPTKPKKPVASWTNAVEESLVNELYKDHSNGVVIPSTKGDSYWERLLKRLPVEGDFTELQLCEKVRRMKARYYTLKDRAKEEGGKLFKSSHEEKMYQLWIGIWDSGTKSSQPVPEDEHSEDESAETAATAPVEVSKGVMAQGNGSDSSSDDENEEEEAINAKRRTAGLGQFLDASKVIPEPAVVSPFKPKPRLEFTPLVPKEDKRKILKNIEEVMSGDDHIEEVPARDDGKKADVVSLADQHLKELRDETLAFFQELRVSCIQALEEQRSGSFTGGLGNFASASAGFGFPGILEGLGTGSGSRAALELQKKWREHRIQELALLSERLQLLQEQCRLQQEELKLQNQRLEQ